MFFRQYIVFKFKKKKGLKYFQHFRHRLLVTSRLIPPQLSYHFHSYPEYTLEK